MRDIKRNKTAFSVRAGRCELLLVKIELPESERDDARLFNEYYRKIGQAAGDWAGKFAGEIKEEYEALGERERKFRFRRYEYRIASSVEQAGDGGICVRCQFRLAHSRDILFEKEISDLWSADCLLMLRGAPRGRAGRLFDRFCLIR